MSRDAKVFLAFTESVVQTTIQNEYGTDYTIKKDRIFKNFKTYPYPKDVGYWFIRDNDLYVVMNVD